MARILCEVLKCQYNCEGGCCLEAIKIAGEKATTSVQTACDSYTDSAETGTLNCITSGCACNNSYVKCDACECKYNDKKTCTSERVEVGCTDSSCCSETECKTFRK